MENAVPDKNNQQDTNSKLVQTDLAGNAPVIFTSEQTVVAAKKNFVRSEVQSEEIATIQSDILKLRMSMDKINHVDVFNQIHEIKIILREVMKEKFKHDIGHSPAYIADIIVNLRSSGVAEAYISKLMDWLNSIDNSLVDQMRVSNSDKLKNFYLNATIQYLLNSLNTIEPFCENTAGQRIICFIGPSGSGKTTSLAKIATAINLKKSKTVELINTDTFRIAGSEQLRVYSKVLDIPFYEILNSDDLHETITSKCQSEYIFIDTPGRSIYFSEQINFLKDLSLLPIPIEFHLVLSSSMKQADIDKHIHAYRFLTLSSLIFTKLDESWGFGEILNTSIKSSVPLSYFGIGQRIPDDIEVATKERVIERILKL